MKNIIFLAARLLATHFTQGQDWRKVPTAYQISVLNFHYTSKKKKAIHRFSMFDPSDSQSLSGTLNIIFLELPKLPAINKCDINNLQELEKWGIFIRDADKENCTSLINDLAQTNRGLKMAQATAFRMTEEQRRLFRQISIEKAERDRITEINIAREQGEHKKAIETARGMLSYGMPKDKVAEISGLPLAEVRQLQIGTEAEL